MSSWPSSADRDLPGAARRGTFAAGELISRARTDLKPHFPPGKGLYYSDTNYQLLGKIIENVTRTSLASALQNYVFRPLGLRHTRLTGSPEPAGLAPPAHVFDHQQDITTGRMGQGLLG